MNGYRVSQMSPSNGPNSAQSDNGFNDLETLLNGPYVEEHEQSFTKFPLLDTRDVNFSSGQNNTPQNLEIKKVELLKVRPITNELNTQVAAWLHRYYYFILGLTGVDASCVSCNLRFGNKTTWSGHIRARVVSDQIREEPQINLQVLHDDLATEALSDFKFEYFDSDDHLKSNTPETSPAKFTLRIVGSENHTSISIHYIATALPHSALCHVVQTLTAILAPELSSKHPPLSVLNHPPRGVSIASKQLLHTQFISQAQEYPTRDAVVFLSNDGNLETISYESLYARALQFSKLFLTIIAAKVPEDCKKQYVIPLYLSTSPELYICYLGILLAGHAFCPLPIDAPADRLSGILGDLNCPVVVGVGANPPEIIPSSLPGVGNLQWIDVSKDHDVLENENPRRITPDDLAYVLYTSGTTGLPKGARISHHSISSSIAAHMEMNPLDVSEESVPRWFQFAAPTFDPSLMEIFVTLSSGATLCSAARDVTLSDPEKTVSKLGASHMMATPSIASLIRPQNVRTLRSLWTMGETLSRRVIENFSTKHMNGHTSDSLSSTTRLSNLYGPTEASINCSIVVDVPSTQRGSVIGEPLPTCSLFVVKQQSSSIEPIPLGFVGELAIGGPQVSAGYLNRPEADKAAFVNHAEYGKVYRTGDRARVVWDDAGRPQIDFLGRLNDDQVKINGQRVELGEIDSVLASLPDISEVVTVLLKSASGSSGGEVLVSLVVPGNKQDHTTIESLCCAALGKKLPSYMHPARYLTLSSLPRSSSAKLDRRALLEIATNSLQSTGSRSSENGHAAVPKSTNLPRRGSDAALEQIVQDALEVVAPTVSDDSNTERLYLDSLTSMRLLQGLRDRGVEELTLKDLLHAKTIQSIAQLIRKRRDNLSFSLENPFAPSKESVRANLSPVIAGFADRWFSHYRVELGYERQDFEVLPTTATQSRLLLSFSAQSPSASGNFVNQSIITLPSDIDCDRLRQSWQKVIERYNILRTYFVSVDDDLAPFAQCVAGEMLEETWSEVSHTPSQTEDLEKLLRDQAAKDCSSIGLKRTFDLTLVKSNNRCFLITTLLHAIFDYGSLQLLLGEVESSYNNEKHPPRTEVSSAVLDHFENTGDQVDEFWTDYLAGAPTTAFPQLTGRRPEFATEHFSVTTTESKISVQDLESACRQLRCSPLSMVQAAWSAILLTYTGSRTEEVVFDSLFANRTTPGTERCMAPTFVTVPTRVSVLDESGNPTLLNKSVVQSLAAHNANAHDKLHSRLGSKHRKGASYDTILALQIFAQGPESTLFSEMEFLPMAHDHGLMMEVWPDKSGLLSFKATYSDEYLDDHGANIMNLQFSQSLEWIMRNPELPLSDVLSAISFNLLSISNPTPLPLTEHRDKYPFIHSQFEERVLSTPDAPALVFVKDVQDTSANLEWSYGELNAIANVVATYLLHTLGPLHGAIIPILMGKQPMLYAAVLGIVKAGGAWCPIDTASPTSRRRELIARTDSTIIITAQTTQVESDGLPDTVTSVNLLELLKELPASSTEIVRPVHDLTSSTNPAYLIWTSGTTGLPKGVPVSHEAATTSMRALQDAIPGSSTAHNVPRCTQFSQHTFDVFVQDLFYTWGLGGTVVSATKEIMVGYFPEFVKLTGATHAHLTPAFGSGVERSSCPSLEVITMIGEKLPQHVADDWGTNMKAYNTYGPAEATVVSTLNAFGGSKDPIKSANVGLPLPSLSCYVMRGDSIITCQGIGELALGGHQLASGYYKNTEKTAEKFRFHKSMGQLLYMTGDIVRMLANGTIEFVGREDDLVKLGGIRVELSEISFALRGCHPKVQQIETFHLDRPDRATKLVVCFVTIGKSDESEEGQLFETGASAQEIVRAVLKQGRQSLPDFMVPGVVIPVEKIPKTPSAKVDRKVLQSIFQSFDLNNWQIDGDAASDEFDKLSPEQQTVLGVVSSLTGVPVEQIKPSSYLPSLGVDSLNAGRLATRLRQRGIPVHISDILKSRTVASLLTNTTENPHETSQTRFDVDKFSETWKQILPSSVTSSSNAAVVPASPLQDSLLAESLTEPRAYWSNHLYSLSSDINLQRLREAWQEVADANEALRTSFVPVAEIPPKDRPTACSSTFLQLISQTSTITWHELTTNEETWQDATKEYFGPICESHAESSFASPPWAITIISSRETRVMMLTIHHCLHDAQSFEQMLGDVTLAYKGELSDQQPRPQLSDCMSLILTEDSERDQKFWTERLQPYSEGAESSWPDLTGKPEHQIDKNHPKLLTIEHKVDVNVESVEMAAKSLGVAVSSLFRMALGILMTDYLESPSVVIGEIFSQRVQLTELERAIAPLVITSPFPFRAKDTIREALAEVEQIISSTRSRQPPVGTVTRDILKKPSSLPLYPAVFVYHTTHQSIAETFNEWEPLDDNAGLTVEHPLALNVTQADGWLLEISAQDTFITPDHLQVIAYQIEALVRATISNPDAKITGILDDASPRAISLATSSIPWAPAHPCSNYPTYWLEKHASEHPDWHAVEIATEITQGNTRIESWTYQTLWQESHKIAARINYMGFHNSVIAMCTGRTLQSYSCIIGIMRSGNTYLPIDDRLPQDRKQLLLKDSGCVLVFTDSQCVDLIPKELIECPVINMDKSQRDLDSREGDEQCPPVDPSSSAYLLYTSGSTGKPKGVMVSHRSLCNFVEGLSDRFREGSELTHSKSGVGKWLGLASRAFDVHLAEMFVAWKLGLTTVTAPRETLLDDLRLALTELRITHAIMVPSLLEQAGLDRSQIPNVVLLVIGGEKLTRRIIDKWSVHEDLVAINAYGPTELAIGCTASVITPQSTVRDIGPAYGNSQAHVLLPETFHYAKRGQSGELCFTGGLVGNGYLNRPDAKGFVEDFQGQRMYRTGDMVRMMANDHLDYLGRSDDQTKIRGQRIELAEVTETIRAASNVPVDVATLVLSHPSISASQLIAFVADQAERSERYGAQPALVKQKSRSVKLKKLCAERLPKYMIPDHVIIVSILPLAIISGKVDAKIVKAFFSTLDISQLLGSSSKSQRSSEPKRPLGKSEELVKEAVLRVIAVDEAQLVHDTNLLAVGFDSLSIVGLVIQLRKSGFQLSVATILSNPTIDAIGSYHRTTDTGESTRQATVPLLEPELESRLKLELGQERIEKLEAILPCLPLQESLVATTLSSGSTMSYINHTIFEFHEDIDENRFRNCLDDLARRAPILRTSFTVFDDKVLQLVNQSAELDKQWSLSNASTTTEAREQLAKSYQNTSQEIVHNINLISPWRTQFVRVKDGSSLLLLSIHHALYDGNSLDMMLDDLCKLYVGQTLNSRATLESLLRDQAASDLQARENFWKQYLSDVTPTQVSSPDTTHVEEQSKVLQLSTEYADLQATAKATEVTPASLLQTVFSAVIAKELQKSDIVFGTILSGRSVPVEGADSILAPCLATIPQRTNFNSGAADLFEVAHQIQEDYAQCLQYQHTPLRLINRWAGADRPLFDCLYSFNLVRGSSTYGALMKPLETDMALDYPFAVEFVAHENSDTLYANCTFTSSFGDRTRTNDLLEQMDLLVTAICRRDNFSIKELGLGDIEDLSNETTQKIWLEDKWTASEKVIKVIVAKVANVDEAEVTKNASFFRLGIDSISAIRLANELRKANLGVSSSDIMRHICIGALAAHLQDGKPAEQVDDYESQDISLPATNIFPTDGPLDMIETVYACTPLQSGMVTGTLVSEGKIYVHSHTVLLNDCVGIEKIRSAWNQAVAEFDILRTSFHYQPDSRQQWVAAVHKSPSTSWVESSHQGVEDLDKQLSLDNELSFTKPPVKAGVMNVAKGRIFFVTLHHALYDGNSILMLFEAIRAMYLSQESISRPPFSSAAQEITKGKNDSVNFWMTELKGYKVAVPSGNLQDTSMNAYQRTLEVSEKACDYACKSLGVTLQTVALVAFGKALGCFLGQRDVVFGHVVAGRTLSVDGVDSIIGPLFNTIPFRLRLDNALQSNQAILSRVQDLTSRAQPHQHAPLQQIQNAWRQDQGARGAPRLFDALFLFQKRLESETQGEELWSPYDWDSGIGSSDYKLNFEIEQNSEGLTLSVTGADGYIAKDELDQLVENVVVAVQDLMTQPSRSSLAFSELSSLPLLPHFDQDIGSGSVVDEQDETLILVKEVLSEASKVPEESIEADTDIFALGLDSISAINVATKLRDKGLTISVADVLMGGTPSGIYEAISQPVSPPEHEDNSDEQLKYEDLPVHPADETSVETVIPCLSGQAYHLFSWLQSGKTLLEPTWAFKSTKLDASQLNNAWKQLQARHSILRTTFAKTNTTEAVQVVLRADCVTDLVVVDSDTELTSIQKLVREKQSQTSNLKSPPVQLALVQGRDEDIILLTLHHAMYDAWSLPLLLSDLSKLYEGSGLAEQQKFTDLVRHVAGSLGSNDEQLYWQSSLQDCTPTIFDKCLVRDSDHGIPVQEFVWAENAISNVTSLQSLARAKHLSMPNVIMLAFSRMLARYTSARNPVFGLYQAGRSGSFSGVESVAGPCLNLTPVVVHDPLRSNPLDAAVELQSDLQKRSVYEQSSLPDILRYVGAERKVLFNTYINILWHADKMALEEDGMFALMKIGLPTDFAAKEAKLGGSAVDGLEWPLAAKGLFVDVSLSADGESVGFGARMEGGLMEQDELEKVLKEVGKEATVLLRGE